MTRSIVATTVAEIRSEVAQPNETVPKSGNAASETLLLVFFGIAALSLMTTFLSKEFHKKREEQEIRGKLAKIPCPNCKFFSKSSYLRCAVQPKLTMTNEAVHCSDFTLQDK